jgi:hypothetical protein
MVDKFVWFNKNGELEAKNKWEFGHNQYGKIPVQSPVKRLPRNS